MDFVTSADRADLARADDLVAEGKNLRTRVLARIRKRRQRAKEALE